MGKRRFAGTVRGPSQNTENSRYDSSGMEGHIRGWDQGVRVVACVNSSDNEIFSIYITSGSHGGHGDVLIGQMINGEWYPERIYV